MNFNRLTELVSEADIITIYRHGHPDCDALGSQFALQSWIRDNFPEKQVYAMGKETSNQRPFPFSDDIDDEIIRHSYAFVLDTANADRVDDQRYNHAKKVICIDHHPDRFPFGNERFVDATAAATCEILSAWFQAEETNGRIVSYQTADYLYSGLLTDTLCFKTSNTTSHTLQMAAYLAEKGIHIPELNRMLFDQSMADFEFANYLRSHVQVKDGKVAYAILDDEILHQFKLTASQARNFIGEFGNVREFESWMLFTQTEQGTFDGSLRSKSITINDVAEQYGGGGHKNAAGVKNLTQDDIQSILNKISAKIA